MGHGTDDGQFHFHSLGKGADLFLFRYIKFIQVLPVKAGVPGLIYAGQYFFNIPGVEYVMEIALVKDYSDLFLCGDNRVFRTEKPDLSVILFELVEYQVDGGTLSGSIFPDEAHNPAFGNLEGNVVQ